MVGGRGFSVHSLLQVIQNQFLGWILIDVTQQNLSRKTSAIKKKNPLLIMVSLFVFFPPFFLLFFTGGRKCHCWRRSDRILISYFSKYSQSTFLNVIFNEKLAAKQTFDDEVKMSTDIINVRDAEKS